MISAERLREIEELLSKASVQPWTYSACPVDWNFPYVVMVYPDGTDLMTAKEEDVIAELRGGKVNCIRDSANDKITGRVSTNARLITTAINILPELIAEIRTLQSQQTASLCNTSYREHCLSEAKISGNAEWIRHAEDCDSGQSQQSRALELACGTIIDLLDAANNHYPCSKCPASQPDCNGDRDRCEQQLAEVYKGRAYTERYQALLAQAESEGDE